MRKLFRFKYEPCTGTCYAWCDFLPLELNKLSEEKRQNLVALMVEAHNHLCDNPDFSFGVDFDETHNMFVAHFRTPESTETFINPQFEDCVKAVAEVVLNSIIPVISGTCIYGDNGAEDLGRDILRACIDEVYRNEHHTICPCIKEVL